MPDYIYLIHPLRHEFFEHPTLQEETTMERHYEYLREATERGEVMLAGPCLDKTFGVVILRVRGDEDARSFMFNDPAVMNNVMVAELHPLKISLFHGK